MKKLTAYKTTAEGGMAMMIASIILMFAYSLAVNIPPEHLGFLAILNLALPFMVQIAIVMLVLGFVIFFVFLMLSILKGK